MIRAGSYASTVASFVDQLKFSDIPEEVIENAKLRFLDTIGVALASYKFGFANVIADIVQEWGGKQESTLWGYGSRVPAPNAALVNGTLSHGHDYDDTHLESVIHVSTTIVPTALAVGEREHSDGKSILTAAIAGSEVLIRIGQAASGQFNIRGFHATSVIGVFAAAAVAGKLLGLTSEQLTMAFGIAGSQAAGLLESEMDGSWVKRFHPGWASHAGIIAALMAKKGFTGPQTVFEGQFGLFNSHIGDGNYDLERIAEGLGKRWELLDVCFKPYACCHYNHPFMDCALYLKQEHGLNLAEITEIECKMHPAQAKEMCEPIEIKRVPRTEYEAKFSLPYCVAVMLAREDGGIEQFTMENVSDPLILELTKKFRCTPYADPTFPKSYPGWVIIRTRDGRTYEKRMAETRGTKANPMSLDELNKKFSSNAVRAVKSERAELISRVIGRFERVSEPRELIELLKADQD